MTYASILVHAEPDANCEPRLRLAADLANQFQAALIGAAAEIFEPPGGFMSAYADVDGSLAKAEAEAVQADLKLAGERFDAAAAAVAGPVEWRCGVGLPADTIVPEARAADLLVVGPRRRQPLGFHNRLDPGDVLMESGRPVLIVPLDQERLDASSILVAWKDTREARRAVRDALPFLTRARKVTLATVCGDRGAEAEEARLQDVADYLSRHGVTATLEIGPASDDTEAGVLIKLAQKQGAGLIVAGGFGHSRMREWVFGGVTQELLWWGRTPVLLSH